MLDFLFSKPFAIRITNNFVQVMSIVGNKKKIKAINFAEEKIPEGIIINNEIIDEKVLSQIIKTTLAKAKPNPISSKKCILVWPENLTYTQLFPSIKPATDEVLKKEMEELISGVIPISLSESNYNYQTYTFGDKKVAFIAVAEKEKLNNYQTFLNNTCGLKVVGIEPEFISLIRNLPTEYVKGQSAAFIHTEFNSINIILTFSGIIFDSIRVKYSLNPKQVLAHELTKSINLFSEQMNQKIVNIFLIGENEFESLLNEKFQLPRKQILKFNLDLSKMNYNNGNNLHIISGAALKTIGFETGMPINLLQ